MAVLTKTALQGYKDYTQRIIAYARYKIGGTYYKTGKPEIRTQPDGTITADVVIDNSVGTAVTVTEIQLFDINDQLWASKAESIQRSSAQEGILYRFRFKITEA